MRSATVIAFLLIFATCIAGARAWFKTAPDDAEPGLWIEATTNVPGYTFVPEPLTDRVIETLGTTNVINGTFQPALTEGLAVRAFLASWPVGNSAKLSAIQHTPEICWVQAGWKVAGPGRQRQIDVPVAGSLASETEPATASLPFELRLFKSSGGRHWELAAWTTILGGRLFPERPSFLEPEAFRGVMDQPQVIGSLVRLQLAARQFAAIIQSGERPTSTKQFVRFSLADPDSAANQAVDDFARRWLAVRY